MGEGSGVGVMENVCAQQHCSGQMVSPSMGLESSLVLSCATRSQELPRVFSKLHLRGNSNDWDAARVTGRLSQARHPWKAVWGRRSYWVYCCLCGNVDATKYSYIWSMEELDGLENPTFLLEWLVCCRTGYSVIETGR